VDNVLDLSIFEGRFSNDETGAPAYDPRIMLKIVLYGYSRGVIHSRDIARCCTENVMFMALSAYTQPHFTTIADFISTMHEEITPLFRNILLYCAEENLISRDTHLSCREQALRTKQELRRHARRARDLVRWMENQMPRV
jgi:transposase